jgi:very-short-patch-repair endonuclease
MRKNAAIPDTLNKAIKQAVSKATGEHIEGLETTQSHDKYPMTRTAHISGSTRSTENSMRRIQAQAMNNISQTASDMYSPFLTHSQIQIPNNRHEIYLWAQFWLDNEPKIAAGMSFYTDFPVSGFELECANGYVKSYFDKLCKKINFAKWLPLVSQEYHVRGDVFIMASIDCKHCHGTNVTEDGDECEHDGATWKSVTILNPDQVEATGYFMDQEPEYYFKPDEAMIKIVQDKKPKELYDQIPASVRQQILNQDPIHLDPNCIYHLKRMAQPWQPYGMSMIRPLFPTLAYKDKLRQAQWLVAERHIVPIKIVKIGSDERPASDEDLENASQLLADVALDPLLTLVTHNNFDFDYYGASGKVLQLTNEYELIDQEILDGLGLTKALLNGEGPTYSNANVGVAAMAKKLEKLRGEIAYWIEEKLFKQISIWNGFTTPGKNGEEEYIYPTVKWKDLDLKDKTGQLQTYGTANQAGVLSNQTYIEAMGFDYDQEVERLRFEQTLNFISTPDANVAPAEGGMGGGYGGGGGGMDLGGMLGGMEGGEAPGGMEGEAPGGMEGGAPGGMEGGAPGGMPMASSNGSDEKYAYAVNIMNNVYETRMASQKEKLNIRLAGKKIKGYAHQEFLGSQSMVVTGRSYFGVMPEEPEVFTETEMFYPVDGGMYCRPMNNYAKVEYREILAAKKKEDQPKPRMFTTLEQNLYKIILSANIPYAFYAQYQAGPTNNFQLDGAFPAMKLGVEADSKTFHASPDIIAKDRQRDMSLAAQGWTILRFTEEELEQQPSEVLSVIFNTMKKLISGSNNSTKL